METGLIDGLPPLYRLALAYAPGRGRQVWLGYLALDARLASVLQQSRDPVLAQIRLAWWRERLLQPLGERPRGEPLLQFLAVWPDCGAGLISLIDGWEALLGEPPIADENFRAFARGRADAITGLTGALGIVDPSAHLAAQGWAFADLACHIHNSDEAARVRALLAQTESVRLANRLMRPLQVLGQVSRWASARSGASSLTSPGALFVAMKAGLLGR